MDLGLEALTSASAAGRDLHRPEFFKLSIPTDRERLREVLKRSPGIQVFDELHSQLTELVRSLNPSVKYTKPELEAAAKAHLGSTPSEEYGLWVFYPWNNRVLHLLDEAEFTLVRTDRNRNKITRDEQARLALVKVGVIGLSVGQSVALTMAQERSFGEIRLADFDTLELSNLNRIRSGTHHLGILKTVNVAREIAEIDPFLKVILFNDGLTRENVDRFFTEGGKLDIVVEECDSVDVKIIARQKAKELRVPVVMDTSDRGMLDVERFDLEPDRPILHGLIDHLDPNDAAKAKTNEEKLPFVLPILNIDTLSKRMKASMLEIESSVTTWPQLATSVVLGGAVAGDVCRRIMLGQFQSSGRWFVDLEEVITDHAPSKAPDAGAPSIQIPATLTMDDMVRMAETISSDSPNDKGFSQAQALEIVRAGCLAPSGGNSQPWKFLLHNGQLFVFMDPARSFSTIDPGLVFARLGIGACIENMRLKANAMGLGISIELQPAGEFPHLLAVMTFGEGSNNDRGRMDPLSDFIEQRCTNRRRGDSSPIAADQLELLRASVAEIVPDALVQFASDRKTMAEVGALCGQAERVRMLNPISHWDMFSREMRWNAEEAKRSGDGVDVRTLE